MPRIVHWLSAGAVVLCLSSGCAHFVETQTIDRFTAALQKDDLGALQGSVSEEFRERAFRLEESVDDLKVVRIPKGEMNVTKVEDLSETEKLVEATVGETNKKVHYRLEREGDGAWRVDDVFTSQEKNNVKAKMSVKQQMDLFATVREFLAAWEGGRQEAAIALATPEFGKSLAKLPPLYFQALAQRDGAPSDASKTKPVAQIDEQFAVVQLRRPVGQMVLTLELDDERWKVSEAAIEGSGGKEHVPSVKKLATVVDTSVTFLDAYAAQDRAILEQSCVDTLFRRSLSAADLSELPLPSASGRSDFKVSIHGQRAFVEFPGESEVVRLDLKQEGEKIDSEAPTQFRVEEVTLYALDGTRQEKRLSAYYTAHATARLFHEALTNRNLPVLTKLATLEFNQRVWQRLNEHTIAHLALPAGGSQGPEIVSTSFQGALTRVDIRCSDTPMSYMLRQQGGELLVDDLEMPAAGKSSSLKETWELMVPLLEFAEGLRTSQLAALQRNSSLNFNRLVWQQTDTIPPIGHAAVRYLDSPLTSVESTSQKAVLTLGTEHQGARVQMVNEHGRQVIDDILLIGGVEPSQRAELKEQMRRQLIQVGLRAADAGLPQTQHSAYPPNLPPPPDVPAEAVEPGAAIDAVPSVGDFPGVPLQ